MNPYEDDQYDNQNEYSVMGATGSDYGLITCDKCGKERIVVPGVEYLTVSAVTDRAYNK